MRGAAYLGLQQGPLPSSSSPSSHGNEERIGTSTIVVDIGGTTADVGVLLPSGFPRQASAYVSVAGVNINFGMPRIESIGLGGGSIVRTEGGEKGTKEKVTVGPDSVGHDLEKKGTVFGGDTLTATDIAVAVATDGDTNGASLQIGDRKLVDHLTNSPIVSKAQARIRGKLESVIDKMKTSPAPLPVLLVGGGSVVSPTDLHGVSRVICPPFHSGSNAVGAAISKVGGGVDAIQNTSDQPVSQIIE